jgi:hypothetical protein
LIGCAHSKITMHIVRSRFNLSAPRVGQHTDFTDERITDEDRYSFTHHKSMHSCIHAFIHSAYEIDVFIIDLISSHLISMMPDQVSLLRHAIAEIQDNCKSEVSDCAYVILVHSSTCVPLG